MSAPYRINSLVELCSGDLSADKGDDGVGAAMRKAIGWLEANPGRWFIVGEITRAHGNSSAFGMDVSSAKRAGFEVETINSCVYARVPHPDGLPLDLFVTRQNPKRVDPLPKLERDTFDWSLLELREAALTARDWLFPRVSYAAA